MQVKNVINRKIIIAVLLFVALSSLQARYEVCFNITQNGQLWGNVPFDVYYLDENELTYKFIGTGYSSATSFWNLNGIPVNAAFDINDNYSPVHVPINKAQTIAIKILGKVIRMDYRGGYYGDALIVIPSWVITSGNSGYLFSTPQD